MRCERFEPGGAGPLPAQEAWRAVRQGRERARLSLWWQGTPPLAGERIGAIGALSATDPEDALALVQHGCARLAERGCTRVLAPMDANTWGAYRCRLDPPLGFAGEPTPGPEWVAILTAAGLRPQTHYISSLCPDLERRRIAPRARRHLAGLRLLPADPSEAAALLGQLQGLVQRAFRGQPWFLPLPPQSFAERLRARLVADPDPVRLLAFDGEEPVGVLLGHRAEQRLVVRTLAVQPGQRHRGLGALLLERAHALAHAAGCRSALHALMLEPGASLALSRHYGRPVARYQLLGCRLAPGGYDRLR